MDEDTLLLSNEGGKKGSQRASLIHDVSNTFAAV